MILVISVEFFIAVKTVKRKIAAIIAIKGNSGASYHSNFVFENEIINQ